MSERDKGTMELDRKVETGETAKLHARLATLERQVEELRSQVARALETIERLNNRTP